MYQWRSKQFDFIVTILAQSATQKNLGTFLQTELLSVTNYERKMEQAKSSEEGAPDDEEVVEEVEDF